MKPAVNEIYISPGVRLTDRELNLRMAESRFSGWGISTSGSAASRWPDMHSQTGFKGDFIILAAALTYREWNPERIDEPQPPLIAPFAARDHYREAVREMKQISLYLREQTGLTKKDFRIFCNSALPEKELAVLSGMGFQGKNTLNIIPGSGSRHVLALLLFPGEITDYARNNRADKEPSASCGACRRCISACPAGALKPEGGLIRERCLQHLSSRPGLLTEETMEIWGIRIYGCDICQLVCPFNKKAGQSDYLAPDDTLRLSLKEYLTLGPAGLETALKGTSLRFSWIDKSALYRNALISSAHTRDRTYLPLLEKQTENKTDWLAKTAGWAADYLEKNSGGIHP